ncbi:MAG TPA: thiolase family protein [Ktedonobacteraceae bacterium]
MSNIQEIVISTPLRTAIGTFGGMLKDIPASDLGATVAKGVLEDAQLDPGQVDQVIVGNVLQAGQGMNPGRQVALKAGLPNRVPGMTLNRVCGSGLQAIISAAQEIAVGGAQVILAGGIENMDLAPFLLPKARYGYRMAMPRADMLDEMVYDGLWDAFNNYHMGITAENVAERHHISRQDADAYALRSHQRATQAMQDGFFLQQIVPVAVQAKKETIPFTRDEHVRTDTSLEKLARLPAIFKPNGTVTAGNASGINDAAALMIVTTAQKADELKLPVAGRLVSYAVVGVDPAVMGIAMVPATRQALEKAGLSVDDIAMFEVNEAYAAVAVYVGRELQIPEEKLNPVGGAVALGHPIGASGAILVVKLLHELERQQARYGLATLCIGGGMGIAAVFERPS